MDAPSYISYLSKPLIAAKKIITTKNGAIAGASTMALVARLHLEKQALLLLAGLILIDFVTGLLVSFKISKEEAKKNGQYATKETTKQKLFGRILFKIKFYHDVIESGRLRLSLLKVTMYMFFIIGAKTIQMMFKIKPFEFSWSEVQWTITTITIAVCAAIEVKSIVFENIKKLGYDFLDKVFSLFKTYKEIKDEINK